MELDVLAGARSLISVHHPIMVIEQVKIDGERLTAMLQEWGYRYFAFGLNLLAVHESDPSGTHISVRDPVPLATNTGDQP